MTRLMSFCTQPMVAANSAVRGADEGDEAQRAGREFQQRRHARHQEHAGGHHGRGVDQRGDRGRALHRVRQPDMQAELRRLAHGADEQQDADHLDRRDRCRRARE